MELSGRDQPRNSVALVTRGCESANGTGAVLNGGLVKGGVPWVTRFMRSGVLI